MLERLVHSRRGSLIVATLADAWDTIRRRRDPLVPPRRLTVFVGAGDFQQMGEDFKRFFVELGGLKPEDDVLDVGSGIGRMAVPLLGYLRGCYEGFDVYPAGIRWCQKQITPRYPGFRFQLADIKNELYNPSGRHSASDYRFPYDDASFDFAFLTSVFTHLLPADARNYLNEVCRVLRKGGTCFATFFLLGEEQPAGDGAQLDFRIEGDGYRSTNATTPEVAVAYMRTDLDRMLAGTGLTLRSSYRGSWSGHESGTGFQDILVAVKSG
jgi:SAM-dependent methyltransferase